MGRTDPDPRRQQILNLLEETGTLNVGDLADRFGVSLVTVRKDLDELGAEGLLDRTFGGAVFSQRSRFNRSFSSEPWSTDRRSAPSPLRR